MLLVNRFKSKLFWTLTGGYFALMALFSAYASYQCTYANNFMCEREIFPHYILPQIVTGFIILFFAQTWLNEGRRSFSYTKLFNASWQNYLTVKLAGLFVGVSWGLLSLCAHLFKAIDIHFFYDLFFSPKFAWPATGFLVGCGIVLFRDQTYLVETIRRVLRLLIQGLLVAVAVIALLFLAALLFTGLRPLLATKHSTLLILGLVAIILFFICVVYQDGQDEVTYAKPLDLIIKAALLSLPIYLAIATYALSLRVVQYGWTHDRLWAALVLGLLAGFAASYAYALLRYRSKWMPTFTRINRTMALVVALVCGLTATPVLDLNRISAASQVARFNVIRINEYGYLNYLRFDLGRAGYQALLRLRDAEQIKANADVVVLIDKVLKLEHRWQPMPDLATPEPKKTKTPEDLKSMTAVDLKSMTAVYPKESQVPLAVYAAILKEDISRRKCGTDHTQCALLVIDVYGDRKPEYLFFKSIAHSGGISVAHGDVYAQTGRFVTKLRTYVDFNLGRNLKEMLDSKSYRTEPGQWKDLVIGDKVLQFQ